MTLQLPELQDTLQSVGAKAVVTLASKLALALLPPQSTFVKLQVRDDKLGTEIDAEMRSELDLSFSKMERMIMDYVNGQNDRVVINQAMKHLIVAGNALIYMGKDGLKNFPLNRYVLERDGNGNVVEIVTKELINRRLVDLPVAAEPKPNEVSAGGGLNGKTGAGTMDDDVEVFTHVKLDKRMDVGTGIRNAWTRYFLTAVALHQERYPLVASSALSLLMVKRMDVVG